ncbi:SPOR domain-containing protein [Marinospirillum alkaliphilum]|uniref:Cell division protein FtsN n=1 Tax=Marinospirillum alkaliphilum DSM 21637 TaxID=1122209 RepID=A0A1K1W886_9GAMM|nr:SPOR domain-containing protein [Marinospirillum alkaliphilum]SFX33379.1 Cell division protein FtsN [Marinospirillum alkaliphilum DSM 21637]
MARDFASRQLKRNQPDAAAETMRSRGAVPKATEEVAPTASDLWSRLPGWGWLAVGLVAGFLVAQLTRPSAPTPLEARPPVTEKNATVVSSPASTAQPAASAERPPQPRFDFYTLLPETEVIAPKVEAYQSTPREAEDLPRFMLQVGSFRARSDAARLEERLKTLGFDRIRVNPVETASGDVWHRVQVGPYQDRRLLARAQDDLARAGLEFMLLRLRDEPTAQPTTAAPE